MNALKFFGTIYLGDRSCTLIELNGCSEELRIGVNLISRIRDFEWNFYDAEDVENGSLVFEGLKFANFDPSGPIPNDWIDLIEARPLNEEFYEFKLSLGSVDSQAKATEIILTVVAKSLAIQSATGMRIRE